MCLTPCTSVFYGFIHSKIHSATYFKFASYHVKRPFTLSFFPHGSRALSGPGPHYRGFTVTLGHKTLGRTPLDEWSARRTDLISPSHRPLPDNTQHSQQTDIHAPGGIRTHNLSKRAAVDPPHNSMETYEDNFPNESFTKIRSVRAEFSP
jgi:hypothetical protein